MVTGLALGGLGGFNAHDAGVLKAAHDCGVRPDIITATSGAIFWTHLFLTDPQAIPEQVRRQADAVRGASALSVASTGDPGIFTPAYRQYWARWARPWRTLSVRELLDRLFPAQVYVPTRPRQAYAGMARDFNDASIPVLFNAFAIGAGQELLFANPAAFDFLGVAPGEPAPRSEPRPGPGPAGITQQVASSYRTIDAGAVEAALWLVLYGFEHRYQGQVVIDGAYHRQLILTELADCDVIYAVKPQSDAWHAAPPANYFEVQDFTTEMWFNSAVAAEAAALVARDAGPRIEPITMHRPLGYFNYFVEKMRPYTEGYRQARAVFERDHEHPPTAAPVSD